MSDLYRTPAEALNRELDHLKERLKLERKEVARFQELARTQGEGLDRLVQDAMADAKGTVSLIADYKAALSALRPKTTKAKK